jgi:hypothetical protein
MAPKPVTDYASLPDAFLVCRDLAHNWDERTVAYRSAREKVLGQSRARDLLIRTVRCSRCKTVRAQKYLASSFERIGGTYTYVEGYLQPETRRDTGALRRAAFERYTGASA